MNNNYPKYDIDRSFGTIVHWAERALINRLQQNFEAAGFDITVEQWRVLVNLWNREGQSQRELAESTHKDKTGITRILHGMERRDLVVRIPDKADQRNKLIYLTRKGREFQQALVQYTRKTLDEALDGLSEGETEACKAVLSRVIRNLTHPREA
jgi:DNA-binding MarR family transcriptional regulator